MKEVKYNYERENELIQNHVNSIEEKLSEFNRRITIVESFKPNADGKGKKGSARGGGGTAGVGQYGGGGMNTGGGGMNSMRPGGGEVDLKLKQLEEKVKQ